MDLAKKLEELSSISKTMRQEESDQSPTTTTTTSPKGSTDDSEVPVPGLVKSTGLSDFDLELKVQQSDPNSPLYSEQSFEALGMKEELLKGVYAMGFNKPSKIQEKALPVIFKTPNNLIAQSQSGTGKTAAFTLGMLNCVDNNLQEVQAICIAPTHELALQIYTVICRIGQFSPIKPLLLIPQAPISQSKIQNQIIIGTPGKMDEFFSKRRINPKFIKMFVLDEADYFLAQRNFKQNVATIFKFLPKDIKYLLFSATYSVTVEQYIKELIPKPYTEITLRRSELTVERIIQYMINCEASNNRQIILSEIFGYVSVGQTVVFCERKDTVDELSHKMKSEGFEVSSLHGGMDAQERMEVMQKFKDGKTKILITTNVVSRGIDVLQVSLVINYDLPTDETGRPDPVTYLHRCGRVGRFGRSGVAISFVYNELTEKQLKAIANHLGHPVTELKHEDIKSISQTLKNLKDLTPLK